MEFLNKVIGAEFSLQGIWDAVVNLYNNVTTEGVGVKELWDLAWGFVGGYIENYVGYILIALSLVLAFFGKKLMGFTKFVAFAVAGFGCGMYFLAPIVKGFAAFIPDWVVGLVVAVVAALLCKFLYWVLIAVVAGYSVYFLAYTGAVIDFTKEFVAVDAGAAVVAIVLAFLLLKVIETVGTAAAGGYLAALAIKSVFDYTAVISFLDAKIVVYIVAGIIAVLGLIVQIATRSKKK